MPKKNTRLKLNDDRKYMGVFIDTDTYEALMQKAYDEKETLSQLVRRLLNRAAFPAA